MTGLSLAEPTALCRVCRKCVCNRCHPRPCDQVNKSRRIFLLGALAAPVVPRVGWKPETPISSPWWRSKAEIGSPEWQALIDRLDRDKGSVFAIKMSCQPGWID